jgi:hypothetical protein
LGWALARMHFAILRFSVWEVGRDHRGAVLCGDCKDGELVVSVWSTIIGRVFDLGAVAPVTAFDRVPIVRACG